MKVTIRTAVLAGILLAQSAAAQQAIRRLDGSTIQTKDIDAVVVRLMHAADVPGVAISIFNEGKIVYSHAWGLRDVQKNLPLTENSVMAGASFTKVAFTQLAMQLADAGTIDLDKPVQFYLPKPLPEYPEYKDLVDDPRYRKITPRMLLNHTSGFPNLRQFNAGGKLNINFEPGSRYAYSGEGIQLLQFLVEALTKTSTKELMQDRVFGPLGMTRTSMVTESRFEDDYANGYDEWSRSLGHQNRKNARAAGSMQTTLHDFSVFLQAVMEGRGVSAKTHELMLTPQIAITAKHQFPTFEKSTGAYNRKIQLSYGLGWGLYQSPYGRVFFKEGHDDGFRNYSAVFDKPKTGIVILTNSSNGEGIFKELLETLLRDTFTPIEWEGYTPWNKLPPRPAPPPLQ